MRLRIRNLGLTSLLLSLLFIINSCNTIPSVPELKAPLSPLVKQVEEDQTLETPIVNANMYFDNTQSMFGYVTKGAVSNYVITINSILDLLEGLIDYSLYALRPDDRNILIWQDIGRIGSLNYYIKDFYTYRGVFENRGDGPLQLLFAEGADVVDFDEINIFVTDLGEQNMRNIVLARRLNSIVYERENYAILLFCIQSQFSGMAAVPLHGVVSPTGESLSMAVDNNFSGIRPFYLLLTGPAQEIFKINEDIAESLESAGLIENHDFFRSVILPGRGIQRTEIEKLITFNKIADTPEHRVTMENSNINFNFLTLRYEDLFSGINRDLPGLNFAFTSEYTPDRSERNHAKINMILPLNNLVDGARAENVVYWINPDDVAILGGSFVSMEEASETGIEIYDSINEELGFTWTKLDPFEYNRFLNISLRYLSQGEEIWTVNTMTEDLLKSEFDNELLYLVENDSGALNYTLHFSNIEEIEYDYVSIYVPVYGKIDRNDKVPMWIDDFNLTTREPFDRNNPGATPDYFTKTDGLLEFYKLLLGDFTSSVELEAHERQMEKQITKLLVNICFNWSD